MNGNYIYLKSMDVNIHYAYIYIFMYIYKPMVAMEGDHLNDELRNLEIH